MLHQFLLPLDLLVLDRKLGIFQNKQISVFFSSFAALDFNVKFMIELENYTKFYLSPQDTEINAGHIAKPPAAMFGGEKHGVVGHKVANTAKGCAGIVIWTIEDSKEKVAVMYSIPYDHNLHSNWVGVGICSQYHVPNFNEMYNGNQDYFKRKEFYCDTDPVSFSTSEFTVEATCGTNHKPTIRVKLIPTIRENLAPKFRAIN